MGRKPLWQVKVAEPKIEKVVKADTKPVRQPDPTLPRGASIMVEHAEDGFQSTIVRSTLLDGKLVDETRLVSTYRPSRNVYLDGGPAQAARPAARIEDRPATPPPASTSLLTPYVPPDTPTATPAPPTRTPTATPAPPTRTPTRAATATATARPSPRP